MRFLLSTGYLLPPRVLLLSKFLAGPFASESGSDDRVVVVVVVGIGVVGSM